MIDPGRPRAADPTNPYAGLHGDLLQRFDVSMTALGPFEPAPRLAVGVSGGGDSLACLLLADAWARRQGGSVTALTVDHGLRPEARQEALKVKDIAAARGIDHRILSVDLGPEPGGVQDRARRARLAALDRACGEAGILHLLLGHTRDDQTETVLMRLAKGSGQDGLAGIPAERVGRWMRILRPLLGEDRTTLHDWVRHQNLPIVDDPANNSTRFARGRLRLGRDVLAEEGLSVGAMTSLATRAALDRDALVGAAAELLAGAATVHPEGWVGIDVEPLLEATPAVALRALGGCLAAVGGADYLPRFDPMMRLLEWLAAPDGSRARTLGGCRVDRADDRRVRLIREPAGLPRLEISAAGEVSWDGRFRVAIPAPPDPPVTIAALGNVARRGGLLPAGALASLPAIWLDGRRLAVPDLAAPHLAERPPATFVARFRPTVSLVAAPFTVVWHQAPLI